MGQRRANRWRQTMLFSKEVPQTIEFPPETLRQAVEALADLLLGDGGDDKPVGARRGCDDAEDQSGPPKIGGPALWR